MIVADYFAMLAKDFSGTPYKKIEHNRQLQERMDRSKGSIEFKHQNISAVLMALGEEWIEGYKPAANFQMVLVDAVVRFLDDHHSWNGSLRPLPRTGTLRPATGFQDEKPLWIGPPPTQSNVPPPADLDKILRIAQKFDVAGRDERNRALGRAGEEMVLEHERRTLHSVGRKDLAKQVRWVSDLDGDGAGYDIASFTPEGRERLIEVKTTNGWERTPFHISRNELAVADERRDVWSLFRLWNFSKEPKAFELHPPLNQHVTLTATSFSASFAAN